MKRVGESCPLFHICVSTVLSLFAITLFTFASAGACPDLEPRGFCLFGPHVVAPGEALESRLFVFVHNAGTDPAAPQSVAFYISTDDIITTSDQLLAGGRDFRDALIAGGIDPVRRIGSLAVPSDWPPGPAFLGVIVDEQLEIAECSEFNNTASFQVIVRAPQNTTRIVPGIYGSIAAAIAAADYGDTIRILTGEYDESFAVNKDLVFVGSGLDSTILRSSTNNEFIMDVLDSVNVSVRDIRFESSLAEPYFLSRGIRGLMATVAVNHCRFESIPNWSLQMESGTVSVDSSEFHMSMGVADVGVDPHNSVFWISDSYGGTRIDHVFDPWGYALGVVADCVIDGSNVNYANGIRLRGTGPVAIVRNNLVVGQHNGTEPWTQQVGGIAALGPMFVEIYGNEVHGFTHGLTVTAGATARVFGNTITSNLLAGVECAGTPAPDLDLGGGDLDSPGLNLIQNNGTWSVRNKVAPDMYARYNGWDSSDSASIDATMYDDEEDPSYGDVIFGPGGAPVPPGNLVVVHAGPWFTLTFDSVLDPGVLVAYPLEVGPLPPRGVQPHPPYLHDIMTTAGYVGEVEVCLKYDEADLPGPELAMTMWHYEGTVWREITSMWVPRADMLCGSVPSLSMFLAGTLDFVCGNTDTVGAIGAADVIYLVNYVFKGGPHPIPVPAAGDVNADDVLTSADIIFLVSYCFRGGPPPECR